MDIEKALQQLIGTADEARAERFLSFLSERLWNSYNESIMDKVRIAESEITWNLHIPNAKEGQPYALTVPMPEVHSAVLPGAAIRIVSVTGLEEAVHGLLLTVADDGRSFSITGTPTLEALRRDGAVPESTFFLTLSYTFTGIDLPEGQPPLERKLPFVINQDPRKLWKTLDVDWEHMPEPKYRNADTQTDYRKVEALPDGTPQKDIVAASKRGRSHAQEAKPRDDHFRLEHMANGWYIMAVADGAGSARYSRKGSEIACNEAVNFCILKLLDSNAFEAAIGEYDRLKDQSEEEARKAVGNYIYNIVGAAAFRAHKAINAEAAQQKLPAKLYATTLLLTICKKFAYGWFVASFWVGDGAICLYDRRAHTAKLLGVPDEGEYAGQTRFLTMPDIFRDATSLYQRLRFNIVDDFTALFLMSDGVSDPKFETDANLNNPDRWDDLWDDLRDGGVELTDDNEASKDQLLAWLDFWSPGNHDDRTIAILYGEETADNAAAAPAEAAESNDNEEQQR